MDSQRIDKWLWHARVVRTRTAAAELAQRGRVRVNGARVAAASRLVREGDVVTVALEPVRVLKVAGFSERRGGASDAALLFENLQPEIVPAPAIAKPLPASARPDRRERREILRLKRPGND
ncbi:MAG: S4 domain-containing protein [Pseudorhodoplanes sp.]